MKLIMVKNPPEKVFYGTVPSPVGKLLFAMTEKGEVCRLAFVRKQKIADILDEWRDEWKRTQFVVGANVKKFAKAPIMLVGTKFQQSIWNVMAKIPRGSVTTYGEIAHYIKNPKASRAVGGACGANPVPYLVPCHRVIAGNGGLGGFSGGLGVKEELLKIEGYLPL